MPLHRGLSGVGRRGGTAWWHVSDSGRGASLQLTAAGRSHLPQTAETVFKEEQSAREASRWLPRLGTAALLLGLSLCVLYLLAPQSLGESVRRHVLARLAKHYQQFSVSVARGRLEPGIGLVLEDVRIAENAPGPAANRELLRVGRITVVTDVQPERLLNQQVPLRTERLILDQVEANAWLTDSGELCLQALYPFPKFGPTVPRIEVHRAKLRLINRQRRGRPIEVDISRALLRNTTDPDGTAVQRIELQASSQFAAQIMVRAEHRAHTTVARASIRRAEISGDLVSRLPHQWAEWCSPARQLDCLCDSEVALRRDASGTVRYKVKTTVHDGEFDHDRLPQPIKRLRGVLFADGNGVDVQAFQGLVGDAVVRAEGRIKGYAWPCEIDLQMSAQGLLLSDRLAASLPGELQTAWNKIQPRGRIDIARAQVTHRDNHWSISGEVHCKGVDVRYEKFPYPLKDLVGRISVSDTVARSDSLSGAIGDSRLQCGFQVPIDPQRSAERWFAIATDGPIAIDRTLLESLTPRGASASKLETFVRSLRPRGALQLESARLATTADGRESRRIVLKILDGHLNYNQFPYPLDNITGAITVEDDLLTLHGLRAENANAGSVTCSGRFRLPPRPATLAPAPLADVAAGSVRQDEAAPHLQLLFAAANVPMDDLLRSALPEAARRSWDALSPSGILDELNIDLTRRGATAPLELDIVASQQDRAHVTSRSLSLRPVALPYRIDVTGGTVRFDGRRAKIHALKGRHEQSTLSADGVCEQNPDGRWELSLDLHSGSRLHPDVELVAALPAQVQEAMRRLQLRGPVSVRGQTRILLPDSSHPQPDIAWNLGLQLEGNRFGDVGPVHGLRGELAVRGIQDARGPRAIGQVRIDSMHVNDLQITGVRGPFSVTGDRLVLGRQARQNLAHPELSAPPESIKGQLFGGSVQLDGDCVLSSGDFAVSLAMDRGQVPVLLADFGHRDQEFTGTFAAQTDLQGTLGNLDLLRGSGSAELSGANLYKLPLIVQILNLLRVTPTEDVAFTNGQLNFSIDGRAASFNDLRLWGDLVELKGGGTLDRMRNLDLTFETRVSPQNSFTQLIRPLRSQRYTLGTVQVRGPLHDLEIERHALERLFPGMLDADGYYQEAFSGLTDWFR